MTLEKFKIIMGNFKKFHSEKEDQPAIWDVFFKSFEETILKEYGNIGWEWIHFYIFDLDFGTKETNVEIPISIEGLHAFLEDYYKIK